MLLVSNVLSLPFRTFKPKNFSHERVSNPMELCKEHRYLDGSGMLTIKALVMTANCYSSTRVDLLTFTAATDRCSIALAAGFGGGGGGTINPLTLCGGTLTPVTPCRCASPDQTSARQLLDCLSRQNSSDFFRDLFLPYFFTIPP